MKTPYLTECPRDAMQGIAEFIPTSEKISYLNKLLSVGFDVLDAGSFVSAKAIPQMADTGEVFRQINPHNSSTKILSIIANAKGAELASQFECVGIMGFPFSVSETFQRRNTNAGIEESIERVEAIKKICDASQKELLVYLSMAFGNPYGDEWSPELVVHWGLKMKEIGIKRIALADTTGMADTALISKLMNVFIPEMEGIQVTAHLHAQPEDVQKKFEAAWLSGCTGFDTAFTGAGGCPMASDKLTGNMNTELVIGWLDVNEIPTKINRDAFREAASFATWLFNKYQ